jgi:hypothetical protein
VSRAPTSIPHASALGKSHGDERSKDLHLFVTTVRPSSVAMSRIVESILPIRSTRGGGGGEACLAQQHCDLRRELLVQESLHARSGRSPATAAAVGQADLDSATL